MRHVERRLLKLWSTAASSGKRKFPYEFMYELLDDSTLAQHYQIDPANSWLLAAKEADIPVYAPGWEDSTLGNIFSANVKMGRIAHHQCVKSGTEQFHHLVDWYLANHGGDDGAPSVGFFQLGGGIAGDFAICAVPCIIQDLRQEVPFWGYFCQITDAEVSYGGYSGAVPNEKITWGKLAAETPKFLVKSDATIVAPLIFAFLLGH
jgi:deoxyhypusine synthase